MTAVEGATLVVGLIVGVTGVTMLLLWILWAIERWSDKP